jgi:NTE family protein
LLLGGVETASLTRTALVLSGGGARGAYQAGVLAGLVEHGFVGRGQARFDVLVGSSAGSINVAALASRADDLPDGIARLERVWRGIHPAQVYRTDVASLGRTGALWAWDLTLGGATRHVRPKALLDTAPLRELLGEQVHFGRIQPNLEAGHLDALAVIATDLQTSNGVVFLQGANDTPLWTRRRWRVERTSIGVEHLMASSAIPIFFPAVEIDGGWFSDGSIRNTAPLRPAINLGAERIIAIGVSGPPPRGPLPVRTRQAPTIAQIAGVLLDAVMLDAIEVDVEHSERVNASVLHCATGDPAQPFRPVEVLWLRPSELVRELAGKLAHRVPTVVRYLMRGLGPDAAIAELASYLLFDPEFCGRLVDLGRADVAAERDRIAQFFASTAGEPAPARRSLG